MQIRATFIYMICALLCACSEMAPVVRTDAFPSHTTVPTLAAETEPKPTETGTPPQLTASVPAARPRAQKRIIPTDDGKKLLLPANGLIISEFGVMGDGSHNDGLTIAAPLGSDIRAADDGVVAYTGDEFRGYGNLVLILHKNGWVTAYAHAHEIIVKRHDQVRRGQVIAKVGKTGSASQTQVHFQLRQGLKPVDPMPFLAAKI